MKNLSLASITLATLVGAGSALAADLPVKAAYKAPAPVAVYDWTGFYVGAHAGYAWTDKNWRSASGADLVSYTAQGGIGGLQGGFNYQTGSWLVGIEAQASWGSIRKGATWIEPDPLPWIEPDPVPRTVTKPRTGTTVENLGTVAVRLGHAFDRSLIYVKGGGAWAYDVYRAFNADIPAEPLLASASGTRWGWMVGLGYEYAFLGNWSGKIEFDYLGLGTQRITLVGAPGVTPASRQFDVRQDIPLVKIGINYRFGGSTVTAKY